MSLIQNNDFQPRFRLRGKPLLFIFLGLTALLVVSTILQQKTSLGQSPRALVYVDSMHVPAQHADSVLILSLYNKLRMVYDRINVLNLDSLEQFNSVNAKTLPEDFHTKLMTYELLDFVFDTLTQKKQGQAYQSALGYYSLFYGVNTTMGNGDIVYDFSARRFHKGFSSDARYLLNEKYLMVLVSFELVVPSANADYKTFEPGLYSAGILVYDLTTLELAGYEKFLTTTSDEVMSGPMKKDYVDQTLKEDLEKNVTMHLNHISTTFFERELWPINHN